MRYCQTTPSLRSNYSLGVCWSSKGPIGDDRPWNGGNKAGLTSTLSFPYTFLDGLGPSHTLTSLPSMSNLSRSLAPLPQPTRARLRSSQILTTLAQIISELVQNSLDAGAKHVDVGVDAEGWECWVRDDGCGISRQELGKVEGRYSESLQESLQGVHNRLQKGN